MLMSRLKNPQKILVEFMLVREFKVNNNENMKDKILKPQKESTSRKTTKSECM